MTDRLNLVPRMDALVSLCAGVLDRKSMDAQLAPIWAEKLRHTYTKVLEIKYPELGAANGDMLPIDTSVAPADLSWEYFSIDQAGYADWIDDEGNVTASGTMTATRHVGSTAELGHGYNVTVFDVERAQASGLKLMQLKQQHARKYHDSFANWVWMFGDVAKDLPGLCNHPNIPNVATSTGGSGDHFSVKTVDEIAADIALIVDAVAEDTIGAYYVTKLYFPRAMAHRMRNLRLGSGDGFASLWDWMKDRYSGDETGQPSIEFKILNEATGTTRRQPKTGTDTSGITGDFVFATGSTTPEEAAFIRARPFTQPAPQERDFVLHHLTNSKIGGCKMQAPLAFRRMDYGSPP